MTGSEGVRQYLELSAKFVEWQKEHPEDSPEEDALCDQLEVLWWALTKEERDSLRDARKR